MAGTLNRSNIHCRTKLVALTCKLRTQRGPEKSPQMGPVNSFWHPCWEPKWRENSKSYCFLYKKQTFKHEVLKVQSMNLNSSWYDSNIKGTYWNYDRFQHQAQLTTWKLKGREWRNHSTLHLYVFCFLENTCIVKLHIFKFPLTNKNSSEENIMKGSIKKNLKI